MTKRFKAWLLAPGFSIASSLISATAAPGTDANAPTDSRLDMVAALQALGPHPSLGKRVNVIGRLVGTWNGEYTEFSKDGTAPPASGSLDGS